MTVSRETVPTVSLNKIVRSITRRLCELGGDKPSFRTPYTNVHGSLLPFLFIALARSKTKKCVVVVDDYSVQKKLYESLAALSPGLALAFVGSGEEEHLTGADLHVLNLFATGETPLLIVPQHRYRLVWSGLFGGPEDSIKLSSLKSREALVSLLLSWQMKQAPAVSAPGQFALRGAIVDFFSFGAAGPLRVEFAEEKLSSARFFDVATQRMLRPVDVGGLVLSAPLVVGSQQEKDPFTKNPVNVTCFFVEPSGSPDIFNLQPVYMDEDGRELDLGCVSHRGFKNNPRVFTALVAQFKESQIVEQFVFLHKTFVDRALTVGVLDFFSFCHLPLSGSFASAPLGFFWVSLDQLIDLPRVPDAPFREKEVSSEPSLGFVGLPWNGPVVHEGLGIGLYRGLSQITKNGVKTECVALKFKHGDLVHVPLERLDVVHKYLGSEEKPALTDLRTSHWQRSKQSTRASVGRVVDQFIQIYSDRQGARGFSFSPDGEFLRGLGETFPYTETVDQMNCYKDVCLDMEKDAPMDRLICGDVGFGKTEIAIRAALKAVCSGKQVSLLAPTTILVNQLFNSFFSRLEPFGVVVRHLSRFAKPTDIKKTLLGLKMLTVDVVIGTHRLLSKDVSIPHLGLIIVDEEHRFGAKHKEMLRVLQSGCDVLSMSATPIPRTLQFSLMGVRDVSTIRTPPPGRLSVITSIENFDVNQIKNAIAYEIDRGGQVFFVQHNISGLGRIARHIRSLFPKLNIGVAHGKMLSDELESVMLRMYRGDVDVLVSTTIIGAGLDLPNVNTILINNAHLYGLSQLYQMRGRVGRSSQQAYCYLLIPGADVSPEAHERLRTIQHNTALGSGYDIALRDLELRGGGNLFGKEQSGHLATVGFHLYCKIVKEVAEEKKQKKTPQKKTQPQLSLSVEGDALIPEKYVQQQEDRLHFYRRLASANSTSEIQDTAEEILDRFGPLPEPVLNLLYIKKIRLASPGCAVESVEAGQGGAKLWLGSNNNGNVVDVVHRYCGVLKKNNASFTVVNDGERTGIDVETSSLSSALRTVEILFESQGPPG